MVSPELEAALFGDTGGSPGDRMLELERMMRDKGYVLGVGAEIAGGSWHRYYAVFYKIHGEDSARATDGEIPTACAKAAYKILYGEEWTEEGML